MEIVEQKLQLKPVMASIKPILHGDTTKMTKLDEMRKELNKTLKIPDGELQSMPEDRIRNIYHSLMDMLSRGDDLDSINRHCNDELLSLVQRLPDHEHVIVIAYKMGFKHGCKAFKCWSDNTWQEKK